MSVDAGLYLTLCCGSGCEVVLEAILTSSWRPGSDGWWYIPLHGDPFEWENVPDANHDEIRKNFREKLRAGETFGVRLCWEGGAVGGELLILKNCEVVFSPTINRVTLGERVTDVSWYLTRLLPVLAAGEGVTIEGWSWRETS
jgi:hypothetical protein